MTSYILNIARVVAAQMVLFGHALVCYCPHWALPGAWPYVQQIGVVLFFCLSGFLIAHSRQNASCYGDFVLRRFARIYSAYLPCLVIIVCIDTLLWRLNIYPSEYAHNFNAHLALANVVMLNAAPVFSKVHVSFLFGFQQFGTARPLWTLSLEWWTYMAFGLWGFHWTTLTKRPRLLPLFLLISWVPLVNIFGKYGADLVAVWLIGAAYYHYLYRNGGGMPRMLYLMILSLLVVGFILDIKIMWYDALKVPDAADYILTAYNLRLMLIIATFFCLSIGATLKYPDIIPNRLYYPRAAEYLARYSFTIYLLQHSLLYLLQILPLPPLALLIVGIVVNNLFALLVASFTEFHYRKVYAFLKSQIQKRSCDPNRITNGTQAH